MDIQKEWQRGMNGVATETLATSIYKEQKRTLQKYADDNGLTLSSIMREIVAKFILENNITPVPQGYKKKARSWTYPKRGLGKTGCDKQWQKRITKKGKT